MLGGKRPETDRTQPGTDAHDGRDMYPEPRDHALKWDYAALSETDPEKPPVEPPAAGLDPQMGDAARTEKAKAPAEALGVNVLLKWLSAQNRHDADNLGV